MYIERYQRLTAAAVALVASIGLQLAVPGQAHAAPVTDYNGAWISWPSVDQCYDSTYYGARVYAQPTFRTPSTGTYGVQLFLLPCPRLTRITDAASRQFRSLRDHDNARTHSGAIELVGAVGYRQGGEHPR